MSRLGIVRFEVWRLQVSGYVNGRFGIEDELAETFSTRDAAREDAIRRSKKDEHEIKVVDRRAVPCIEVGRAKAGVWHWANTPKVWTP